MNLDQLLVDDGQEERSHTKSRALLEVLVVNKSKQLLMNTMPRLVYDSHLDEENQLISVSMLDLDVIHQLDELEERTESVWRLVDVKIKEPLCMKLDIVLVYYTNNRDQIGINTLLSTHML